MKPKPEVHSGFTLIEILVALAILAGALVVLTEGYVNTLNALSTPEESPDPERELAFVRERVLRIPTRDLLENGGIMESLTAGRVRWEAELYETEIIDLHQLRLVCEFLDERETYVREYTVLRPQWSDPLERGRKLEEKSRDLEASRLRKDWIF